MPYQQLDYPFSGGVDEKTQSELVEPGAVLSVANLRELKNGSMQKRPSALSLGTPKDFSGVALPVTLKRLIGYRDEICATDNLHIYSRVSSAVGYRQAQGYAPQLDVKVVPVAPVQQRLASYDSVLVNGFHIITYTLADDTTTVASVYTFVLDSFGVMVLPPTQIFIGTFGAALPQVAVTYADNAAWILWGVAGSGNIAFSTLDCTTVATMAAGWAGPANLITNMNTTTAIFDVCSLGTQFIVAYVNVRADTALVQQLTVKSFNSLGSLQATNTTINTGAGIGFMTAVAVSGSLLDNLFVAYVLDTQVTMECVSLNAATLVLNGTRAALSTVMANPIVQVSVLRMSATTGIAVASAPGVNWPLEARMFSLAAGAIVPTYANSLPFWNLRPYTKLFLSNSGRAYCAFQGIRGAGSDSWNANQLLLADMTATMTDSAGDNGYIRTVANINPRLVNDPWGGLTDYNLVLPKAITLSATKTVILSSTLKSAVGSSLDVVTLDWGTNTRSLSANLGENVALSGSPPSFYDGVRCAEMGFFQRPSIVSATSTGAGDVDGAVKYVAVFEQMDDRGQWHQSNVSDVFPFAASTDTVEVVCRTLTCTNRVDGTSVGYTPQSVRGVLYRTHADGNTFFRVVSTEMVIITSAPTFTFTDNIIDTSLGAPLYTQPGTPGVAQVKVTPPPLYPLITHQDRLVGANGRTVWFSGTHVSGEGYWFADLFQFDVNLGGDITALASMDGAMVVFKTSKIAFVDGQGPPDNGAGGDFSSPQFIAADVGCINQNSVVVGPMGVMFQSLRGIELLSRSRSLAMYFGAHVEDSVRANPYITSAVLDEAKGIVTFTCMPSAGASTGVNLVYDYVHSIWTKDFWGDGSSTSMATSSAMMWGQNLGTVPVRTWLDPSGIVYQEVTSSYLDGASAYVSGRILTPWIKMAGLQGYGRTSGLALLLHETTPCDITVNLRLDYRSDIVQTRTFTAAEIAGLNSPMELWMTFKTQKCAAFQLEMLDSTPTGVAVGTGQGPVLVGLRIEYQAKAGKNRLAAGAAGG